MTPHYADDRIRIYQGEALAVLAALPTSSVAGIITDPPYSSGGMVRGDRTQDVHTKYVNSDSPSQHTVPTFTGDNRDQRAYGYWSALWLAEALRVTEPGGICVLFTDWRQLPTTTDALQAGGWVWRGIVPWHKPNGRMMQGRPANNCEYAVWGTAGPRALDAGETLPGFVASNAVRDRVHIAQKPIDVMRVLVRTAPAGGWILDPFAGSGSTGVAALIEGRRFIGVELLDHHVDTTIERLRRTQLADSLQDTLPIGLETS